MNINNIIFELKKIYIDLFINIYRGWIEMVKSN